MTTTLVFFAGLGLGIVIGAIVVYVLIKDDGT